MAVVKTVFYSICPEGTGDKKTGSPTVTTSGGVGTFSVEQTANIGVGCRVTSTTLTGYIAPNRIAFNSGGTAEIKIGHQIKDAVTEATGVVAAVSLSSGTWAAGTAAGFIYFQSTTGAWGSSNNIDSVYPAASNVATENGSYQGNIGAGNTQFVLLTKLGADVGNVTNETVTSIAHEYASQSAAEIGLSDGNHLNTTNSVTGTYNLFLPCYYDEAGYTLDTTSVNYTGQTTDTAAYWINVYSPMGGAESIKVNGAGATWDNNKYALSCTTATSSRIIAAGTACVKIRHIQIEAVGFTSVIVRPASTATAFIEIHSCILRARALDSTYNVEGIQLGINDSKVTAYNNVFIDLSSISGSASYGINQTSSNAASRLFAYNNTLINCKVALKNGATGHFVAINNLVRSSATEPYQGTFSSGTDYNATDSSDDIGTGSNNRVSQTFTFVDESGDDFRLATGDAGAKDFGVSDPGSGLFWADKLGASRPQGAAWDIGAFEGDGTVASGIMPLFQGSNLGMDLFNGSFL